MARGRHSLTGPLYCRRPTPNFKEFDRHFASRSDLGADDVWPGGTHWTKPSRVSREMDEFSRGTSRHRPTRDSAGSRVTAVEDGEENQIRGCMGRGTLGLPRAVRPRYQRGVRSLASLCSFSTTRRREGSSVERGTHTPKESTKDGSPDDWAGSAKTRLLTSKSIAVGGGVCSGHEGAC